MWIMLREKLPTEVSPPKMSLFWSTPWPLEPESYIKGRTLTQYNKEKKLAEEAGMEVKSYKEWKRSRQKELGLAFHGYDPDYDTARRIFYKGENIRVWDHEFSEVSQENMRIYILEDESHELVMADYIDNIEYEGERTKDLVLDAISTPIYEAALLDGCSENQARLVAIGMDVTEEDVEFAPVGWYKIKREIGLMFCDERELEETDHREKVA
jgi:hypothetical protein